jgi:hypothetical protein
MPDPITELLSRNLQEVFGENDAQRRRAALDELYTDDCVLFVPTVCSRVAVPSMNSPELSA